jgi:HAE1 family hydrophobic/amphiphilic exporter-1
MRQFYVRSDQGTMVPLDNLVRLEQSSTPQVISHYNLFRSADIAGAAAPGRSSGQAIEAMNELSEKALPRGFGYEWTGLSREELESAGIAATLFGLGALVVYLTLAAQYESFVLPFIVLLAVPMAILGALSGQGLRGLQNDVYCQIGLVMLVGLASKNAILIVEFAEQLRRRGLSITEAAGEAARIRLHEANAGINLLEKRSIFKAGRRNAGLVLVPGLKIVRVIVQTVVGHTDVEDVVLARRR